MDEFRINSRYDGLELSVAMCEPGGERIDGIVQIVHGMCEHKERYYPFMQWLAGQGYASIIHDHRGHGASIRNEGDLGYMYDGGWRAMVNDVETVGDVLRCQYPGKVLTLLGHSMGSKGKFNKSIKRMTEVGYKDVRSIAYEGMRHEILNETRRQDVWDDVLDFIKEGN